MFEELEKKIGYTFADKKLLTTALTHTSYVNEKKDDSESYERLEFLGDALLDFFVGEYIFNKKIDMLEGDMSKLRARLVCTPSIAECSKLLDVGQYILLGKGEELTGGRDKQSILADVFESVIAAIYLDSNINNAREFAIINIEKISDKYMDDVNLDECKSVFQEIVQKNPKAKIKYEIIAEEGPQHDRTFSSNVYVDNMLMGTGKGKTKKASENEAAKKAIEFIKKEEGI